MRRLSLTGVAMCVPYAALIVFCLRFAYDPQVNDKSRLVWKQLPVLLQMMIADGLGLTLLLDWLPWATSYVLMAAPMFLALYLLGSVLENTFRAHGPAWKDASSTHENEK
ncbi:hypothetical protein LMG31886_36390 [Xanthomonas hydrangeae]|uniref:Uncharacterized protein n=1 Tax=Xanthomonas hydrangeae TaxID=2775159 RepID=A0AAU0B7K4_9XANT|nr:hypothetical protein [Xanthomonas hydrangeae]WOB48153.1 hypothetical protein NYR97_12780 [Xanthomonas hydrangeae]CAD7724683.1 hypothetical protein LMG31884_37370 [Xanthomonas hydrangeae]CAD7724687.1 hypothetical protein LMG31884_37370 [Xanthomonas hydrangeae]CAD7735950.1 hypothetical protein LMG31885_24010 [Xanthomonas hydrangeae]CAD7735953.1 hypothetical protein LMG31885_24010 [Xanthomonas hydrangeae]